MALKPYCSLSQVIIRDVMSRGTEGVEMDVTAVTICLATQLKAEIIDMPHVTPETEIKCLPKAENPRQPNLSSQLMDDG